MERHWIFDPESTGSSPVAPTLALVAQWEERLPTKQKVPGLSPGEGTVRVSPSWQGNGFPTRHRGFKSLYPL
jgi:hypothetical protein